MLMKIVPIALILAATLFAQTISVEVFDATIEDERIKGASVYLQFQGERTDSVTTDAKGKAVIKSAKPIDAETQLVIEKDGFSDLTVQCPCDGLTYALSPVLKSIDSLRIVLSWGKTPKDLDSHLVFDDEHIYYDRKGGFDAEQDVEDTKNAYETITIRKLHSGARYVYAVHDFSNRKGDMSALTRSGARVFVYVGETLIQTHEAPQSEGNVWIVFRIGADGDLETINTLSTLSRDAAISAQAIRELDANISLPAVGSENLRNAQIHNRLGEASYREGRTLEAIAHYRKAKIVNQSFTKAYSNLGQAYHTLNLLPESVWSYRKALALASGNDAHIVRANSFYEIARIYEQSGNFVEAMRNYEFAKEQNSRKAYDDAIKRLREKI
ncbi:hypothetical protein AGMMS50229_17290 [Campylobacterota bacterium]|nr:hypothetical protein AGMMS50229_17290 [Campylobacterota bacterium]